MEFSFEKLALILAAFNWGAIFFVSVVHYPLFADVHETGFVAYHRKHVAKTTLLLGTSLSLEMIVNIFLFFLSSRTFYRSLPLIFLGIGWGITFFVSVPQHHNLEKGFSERAHRILKLSNWGRVFSWGAVTAWWTI